MSMVEDTSKKVKYLRPVLAIPGFSQHGGVFIFKIASNYHLHMKFFLRDTICLHFPTKNFFEVGQLHWPYKVPQMQKSA